MKKTFTAIKMPGDATPRVKTTITKPDSNLELLRVFTAFFLNL